MTATERQGRTTSIVVPPALMAHVAAIAADKGVSVSAVVRWALTDYLLQHQPTAPRT